MAIGAHAPLLASILPERVEVALRRRLQLEELISRLSARFIHLPISEFEAWLDWALATVGEFTGVDRASIMVAAPGGDHLTLLRGWSGDGAVPAGDDLSRIEMDQAPWWEGALRQGQIVAISNVADLSDELASGRAMLQARGHRAIIMVPIQARISTLGFLSLACVREQREWDAETASMLRMVAELLAHALNRKQIEEDLRASEERFRALIEHSQDPVSLFDAKGRLLYTTPAGIAMFGAGDESQIGNSIWKWVHPDDRDKVGKLMLELAARPGVPMRSRIRRLSGERYLWLDITATNWLDNSAIQAYVVNIRDITAQVDAEEKIRRLNEELERRVKERTADLESAVQEMKGFNYSVSHDLRGPLRVIAGYSRLVSERLGDSVEQDVHDDLLRIESSAQHMSRVMDALLSLSRLSREPLRRQSVDLSELAHSVAAALRAEDPSRTVDVRIEEGCSVVGDRRLLGILLENLLGNAWKYTGGVAAPVIEVGRVKQADAGGAFFVRDNGVGFEMTYAHKLFRPFSRLHSAAQFEGVGIGLAIVHRIVQRHGGRVWAEATPQQGGAAFFFTIPE
ncbi:MAG TPA: ATP-binding protein [Candidatus Limnocylindrales bacterium]|nr:ATP-binding protein [Candidatus Limnocylindrales bacterium]